MLSRSRVRVLIGKIKLFSPTLASTKVMFGLKNSLEKDEI